MPKEKTNILPEKLLGEIEGAVEVALADGHFGPAVFAEMNDAFWKAFWTAVPKREEKD